MISNAIVIIFCFLKREYKPIPQKNSSIRHTCLTLYLVSFSESKKHEHTTGDAISLSDLVQHRLTVDMPKTMFDTPHSNVQ